MENFFTLPLIILLIFLRVHSIFVHEQAIDVFVLCALVTLQTKDRLITVIRYVLDEQL